MGILQSFTTTLQHPHKYLVTHTQLVKLSTAFTLLQKRPCCGQLVQTATSALQPLLTTQTHKVTTSWLATAFTKGWMDLLHMTLKAPKFLAAAHKVQMQLTTTTSRTLCNHMLQLGAQAVLLLQTPWQHKGLCSTPWVCNTLPLREKGRFCALFS